LSLAKKTTVGVLWNFAEQISRRGIQVAVTLLLAYFLTPEDFGLVAMLTVFIALGTSLMDSGFKQALIRLKGASQVDFDTAFYANIFLGVVSYTILFISAPYVVEFYDEPRLLELIRVVALVIVINSLSVVQVAKLSRDMNFKAQLKANVPAAFISGIGAIGLAYFDFGVWALIAQMLLQSFFVVIFLWKQKLYRPSLNFCKKSLYDMYNFGYKLFLSAVLDIVFRNLYVIIIAKYFSATTAGLYFFADKIREMVVMQIVSSIQSVTYPALATMQDDNERLKENYRKIVKIMTFVLFPITLFFAALSDDLFQAFLPEKWWDASEYLSIMLIAWLLMPMHAININIVEVKGRSDLFLYLEIVKKIIAATVIYISIEYGIYGLLVGQIVGSMLAYIPNAYASNYLIGYSIKEQIIDILPIGLLSGLIGLCVYFAQKILEWNVAIELVVLGSFSLISYFMIAYFWNLSAYKIIEEMIFRKFKKGNV